MRQNNPRPINLPFYGPSPRPLAYCVLSRELGLLSLQSRTFSRRCIACTAAWKTASETLCGSGPTVTISAVARLHALNLDRASLMLQEQADRAVFVSTHAAHLDAACFVVQNHGLQTQELRCCQVENEATYCGSYVGIISPIPY